MPKIAAIVTFVFCLAGAGAVEADEYCRSIERILEGRASGFEDLRGGEIGENRYDAAPVPEGFDVCVVETSGDDARPRYVCERRIADPDAIPGGFRQATNRLWNCAGPTTVVYIAGEGPADVFSALFSDLKVELGVELLSAAASVRETADDPEGTRYLKLKFAGE